MTRPTGDGIARHVYEGLEDGEVWRRFASLWGGASDG